MSAPKTDGPERYLKDPHVERRGPILLSCLLTSTHVCVSHAGAHTDAYTHVYTYVHTFSLAPTHTQCSLKNWPTKI